MAFSSKGPKRAHLVVGKRGLAGEIDDLRKDISEAFQELGSGVPNFTTLAALQQVSTSDVPEGAIAQIQAMINGVS